MDFETYSEAGYIWNAPLRKWISVSNSPPHGIGAVGAWAYSEHPSTEVLMLKYDLLDGIGHRLWVPGWPNPTDLFRHLAEGRKVQCWNCTFEFKIWNEVCTHLYGWPALDRVSLIDSMAKARAFSVPGKLEDAGTALDIKNKKITDGTRLITKFSEPRDPTKNNPALRNYLKDDPIDYAKMVEYCDRDITAEAKINSITPDLSEYEERVWRLDQEINDRGIKIDVENLDHCISIVEQLTNKLNAELRGLTKWVKTVPTPQIADYRNKYLARECETCGSECEGFRDAEFNFHWQCPTCGIDPVEVHEVKKVIAPDNAPIFPYVPELRTEQCVNSAFEVKAMTEWIKYRGVYLPDLKKETISAALEAGADPLPPDVRRVLEIRQILSQSSVKKLFSIRNRLTRDGRLHDLLAYCGADRTGRWAGRGPQPQNLKSSGPELYLCPNCGHYYGIHTARCPWCDEPEFLGAEKKEWSPDMMDDVFFIISTGRLDMVEYYFGDAMELVAGSLRALFIAGEGKELISSDWSAIEAVVLAALAGEEWRLEVFRTHGKIYEMSASKITGVPFETLMQHKATTGKDHPLRKKVGKVAELASGYYGGVSAWKRFGAEDFFKSDAEIKEAITKWRFDSPMIVRFWKEIERAAILAVQHQGQCYAYRGLTWGVIDDVLYCQLLSGRCLTYHKPRLHPQETPWGSQTFKLSFMGWNSDRTTGPIGWYRIETHGGKLTENIVQATSRDILAHALLTLNSAGYPPVLHVHDEPVSEVPEGWGSTAEYERLMTTGLPQWCASWPIRAGGGWRGKRFRK
jgi:hypothetical protein